MDEYASNITMVDKDVLHAKLAKCFITIGTNRYNFMQAKNLEANFEIEKSDLNILGRMATSSRPVRWKGSGTAEFRMNTSIFREIMYEFQKTGKITYFDMQITNFDPNSQASHQTIILKNCTIDGGVLAKFDVDGEWLEEEMDFTFEAFEMPEKFKMLEGMVQ